MPVALIDLFAGPGGLNEGFSHVRDRENATVFNTVLSVEMNEVAHRTLELRALYRKIRGEREVDTYIDFITGVIDRSELYERLDSAGKEAKFEAFCGELGKVSHNKEVDRRLKTALGPGCGNDCVIIGGPPCQAYSLAGRARRSGETREEFESDPRHRLYLQYLRVVNKFRPAVFVMENVAGLQSAQFQGKSTLVQICRSLRRAGYQLHGLGPENPKSAMSDNGRDFLVHSEFYGIPQRRKRLFIVGVRNDIKTSPDPLVPDYENLVTVGDVIGGLPKIRSRVTRRLDSSTEWAACVRQIRSYSFKGLPEDFIVSLKETADQISDEIDPGGMYLDPGKPPSKLSEWFLDPCIKMVLNHNSRGHMKEDLHRYFFWAKYSQYFGSSPLLHHAPKRLLPNHQNVNEGKFADRFRVQVASRPSSTITSHMQRDGHAYIHHDPLQCRSWSVREAARAQTFPDNYFFDGPATQQYGQVGNAVPPLLAKQIGEIVAKMLS
ncbi:MAG: DNA cytosine methyltransferase [bacterium]